MGSWKKSCPCAQDIKSLRLQGLQTCGTGSPHHDPEGLVLEQLWPLVQLLLDPLQFAYQPQLGVEDAIIYLLNHVTHQNKPASTVRVMFFDFSTVLNTIHPALLAEKLIGIQVDFPLGIIDYLTGHSSCAFNSVCQTEWSGTLGLSSLPLHPLHQGPPICSTRTVIPSLCVLVGSAHIYWNFMPMIYRPLGHSLLQAQYLTFTFGFGAVRILTFYRL